MICRPDCFSCLTQVFSTWYNKGNGALPEETLQSIKKELNVLRYAKFLSSLLLIVCLLASFAMADTADFTFVLNSAGTGYVVEKYSGTSAEVVVPASYNGLPVTEIGEGAFENNTTITVVSLPSCITRLSKRCFKNCTKLTSVLHYNVDGTVIRIPGDVDDNQSVDMNDAMLLLRYVAGEQVTINQSNADVNGDGKVDIQDALVMLQQQAGWGVKLQ